MRAITLWRPWTQAILHGGKDIENRPWRLWESQVGKPIALHAGKSYDAEGAEWMRSNSLYDPPRDEECPLGIVGVVVFSAATGFSDSPWFQGPFGWVVADVKALEVPILIKGNQGLWVVPPDALLEIDRQLGTIEGTFARDQLPGWIGAEGCDPIDGGMRDNGLGRMKIPGSRYVECRWCKQRLCMSDLPPGPIPHRCPKCNRDSDGRWMPPQAGGTP